MAIDMTGQKCGRLAVLKQVKGKRWHGQFVWLCQCDCGNRVQVPGADLRKGHTQSCGCLNLERIKERSTKHGAAGSHPRDSWPEYNIWVQMKQRCYNHKSNRYYKYGARGIKVCDRWRNSFENFIADMGRRPKGMYGIERKNNDGNYEPDNCCWATRAEQAINKTNNVMIEIDGQSKPLSVWCREYGKNYGTVWSRLKLGYTPLEALTASRHSKRRRNTKGGDP